MIQNYDALDGVVTPEIQLAIVEKEFLFNGVTRYMDADDELIEIARFIRNKADHNSDINPERIKYLYTTKAKKDGGRFISGTLSVRGDLEKMVNDEFDYILIVHYKIWKSLDIENKVIQLDKILCGVDVSTEEAKKSQVDSKEYLANMNFFGADTVLKSSEVINLGMMSIVEKEKEEKQNAKKGITTSAEEDVEGNE